MILLRWNNEVQNILKTSFSVTPTNFTWKYDKRDGENPPSPMNIPISYSLYIWQLDGFSKTFFFFCVYNEIAVKGTEKTDVVEEK